MKLIASSLPKCRTRFNGLVHDLALIAIAGVLGVNFGATIKLLGTGWARGDFVSTWEAVMAPAITILPRSGEIGFISNAPPTDAIASPEATRRYYLTQYAVAPLLLNPWEERSIAIAVSNDSLNMVMPQRFSTKHIGHGVFVIDRD